MEKALKTFLKKSLQKPEAIAGEISDEHFKQIS